MKAGRLCFALLGPVLFSAPLLAQATEPAGPVPVRFLQARRQALVARIKTGVAVIQGQHELSNDPPDSDYPQATSFRQDNDFFYLTGLETPDSWLIVVATDSAHGETHLFLPPRNPNQERWTGPKLGPGPEAASATGIPVSNIHSADSVASFLRRMVRANRGGGGGGAWAEAVAASPSSEARPSAIRRTISR